MRKEKVLGPMEQFLFCAFRDHPGCRNGPQLWQFLWFSSFCVSFSLSKNLFLIRWMSFRGMEAWEPMSYYLLFRISNASECHRKLFSQLLPEGDVIVDFANKTTRNSEPLLWWAAFLLTLSLWGARDLIKCGTFGSSCFQPFCGGDDNGRSYLMPKLCASVHLSWRIRHCMVVKAILPIIFILNHFFQSSLRKWLFSK